MRQKAHWQVQVIVGLVLSGSISVLGAPPDPEFTAAKQTFLKEMKKKSPSARADAVSQFSELALPETAEFLLKRGLNDPETSVREAVRTGLRRLARNSEVEQFLFDELKKSFRKGPSNESHAIELLRSLTVTDDESRQAELVKALDEFLDSSKANLLVPISVIDDCGIQGDHDAVRSVVLLAKAKRFEGHFGYRRCVVQSMSQIRQKEAVTFLIDLLPKTQGLIQYDVIQYLTRLTNKRFGDNEREWSQWWDQNQSDFQFPPAGTPLPSIEIDDQKPSYYGIPICAKRIVFVLDTSASMRGQPIDAAKQALLKAIESLPQEVAFDVIFFDAAPSTWQPRLVPATADAKQNARRTVIDRAMRLGTASSAALNAAFSLEPEAIYFLSDGEPTDGVPAEIVSFCTQFNRTRRVSIHTIGVVTQRNGGIGLKLFMEPLSERNYGTFRLVE